MRQQSAGVGDQGETGYVLYPGERIYMVAVVEATEARLAEAERLLRALEEWERTPNMDGDLIHEQARAFLASAPAAAVSHYDARRADDEADG